MSEPRPALVLDASEWFLDESWREHVAPRHWRRLPSRADAAIRAAADPDLLAHRDFVYREYLGLPVDL